MNKEEQIAEILENNLFEDCAKQILALFPEFKVEVECPECGGKGYINIGEEYRDGGYKEILTDLCGTCNGDKTITLPVSEAIGKTGKIVE